MGPPPHRRGTDMARGSGVCSLIFTALVCLAAPTAMAQAPAGPPAVGVIRAAEQQLTQTDEFTGTVQAVGRVALVARVSAFLEKRQFVEGAEVKKGDLLYLLEQPPFQAQHRNAELTLQRAQALLPTAAGQQSNVDAALASERALAAQIAGAQAQLEQAQINLGYTEIRAAIDGRISSTAVTEGNVVSPTSGTLATIVSQDPMYVNFPVSTRAVLALRARYVPKGGFNAVVVKLRLPDGRIYAQDGRLDYVSPTTAANTDTITLRAVIPNPLLKLPTAAKEPTPRELFDGEFVTALLEGVQPITVLGIPRAAVLADQQGDYIYVVDGEDKAQQRRIQLGQSTPSTAVVTAGLKQGELVITEGVQRVRPGEKVSPSPATPQPAADKS